MRTIVAVLRGGPTPQYENSLQSGAHVLSALNTSRYEPRDVLVSRDGYWHLSGTAVDPERALRGADVVFNCIHGRYGEDGWLHGLIDRLGHRVVGSSTGPLSIAYHKETAKSVARRLGILVPAHQVVLRETDIASMLQHVLASFPLPAVVKPVGGSNSQGVMIAADLPSLQEGIQAALALAPKALVEELIAGDQAQVGIVEGLRGEPHYAFAVGALSQPQQRVLKVLAGQMHRELGLRHYSSSEFITNARGAWYLETNALPALTHEAPFVKGLQYQGVAMPEFVEHVVWLAKQAR